MEIKIDNYHELLGLHKTIMSAKFDPDPWLPEIQGSPFSSSVALKVFELIIEWWKSEGNDKEVEKWENWQRIDKDRREYQLLLKKINELDSWIEMSIESRKKYIINFMSPLKIDKKLLDETINLNNKANKGK